MIKRLLSSSASRLYVSQAHKRFDVNLLENIYTAEEFVHGNRNIDKVAQCGSACTRSFHVVAMKVMVLGDARHTTDHVNCIAGECPSYTMVSTTIIFYMFL